MSFLADIISSTEADLKKQQTLVKGKKWVKRGVINKINDEKEYKERLAKKAEAERAKRRRQEAAAAAEIEQMKKKARRQLRATEDKLGGAAGSASSSASATSAGGASSSNVAASPATSTSNAASSSPRSPGMDTADGGSKLVLPLYEVIRRLRELGAPITLFGETDVERLQRMRKVEVEGLDDEGVLHTGTHAMRNVFLKGKQHREGDIDEVDDLAEFDDEEAAAADRDQMGLQGEAGIAMTDSEAQAHAAKKEKKKKKADHEVSTETFVLRFFRRMLKEWSNDLAERPEHVKNSPEGRIATKIQKQCKDYMRPFLKMCRAKTIEKTILTHAKKIVDACLKRDYVFAHQEYMRMAIGNAPWPIGVTNVGIHERVGRENISTSKIAHVLNDERQRKYVTSMKRLLTYCQTKYPTDPSKMVGN